jgi:hypothetical protein
MLFLPTLAVSRCSWSSRRDYGVARGGSAAIVFDAREARITTPNAPRLGATGVHLFLLPAGSTFDPRLGRATLPAP